MKWRFVAQDWNNSASKREIRDLLQPRLSLRLEAPSSLSFSINEEHEHATFIKELITDIIVSADGVDIDRYRVGPGQDSVGQTNATASFTAADYREVLKRRELRPGDVLDYTADQAVIALALINTVEGRTNGDYGITAGVGATTGITRTRNFKVGQSVGKEIDDMSKVANGFDWRISPAMALDIYYPNRGANNGQVLEYGRSVQAFTRNRNPSDFANDDLVTGSQSTAAVAVASATVATDPMGRWDSTFSFPDISEQATLNDRSAFLVAETSKLYPKYNVTLSQGFWKGPSHIGLGDTVRLFVRFGRINDDIMMRVFEITVTPDADGDEQVSMGLYPA